MWTIPSSLYGRPRGSQTRKVRKWSFIQWTHPGSLSSKEDVWISNFCFENRLLQCNQITEVICFKTVITLMLLMCFNASFNLSTLIQLMSWKMNRFLLQILFLPYDLMASEHKKKTIQTCFFCQYSHTAVSSCSQ